MKLKLAIIMLLTTFLGGCSVADNLAEKITNNIDNLDLQIEQNIQENYENLDIYDLKTVEIDGYTFDIPMQMMYYEDTGSFETYDYFFDIDIFQDETKEIMLASIFDEFIFYQEIYYAEIYDGYTILEETLTGFTDITVNSGETYDYNIVTVSYNDNAIYAIAYILDGDIGIYLGIQSFENEKHEDAIHILLTSILTMEKVG